MEIRGHTIQGDNKSVQVEKQPSTHIYAMRGEAVVGHIVAFPQLPSYGTHTVAHAHFGINRVVQPHDAAHHARDCTNLTVAFGTIEWQNVADVTVLSAMVNDLITCIIKIQARHQGYEPTELVILPDRKAYHRNA